MFSNEWLLVSGKYLRVFCFLGFFFCFAWLETRYAWRQSVSSRLSRWSKHLSLSVLSKVVIRLVFPLLLLDTALIVESKQLGALNHFSILYPFQVILGVIALDGVVYFNHRLMHRYKWFWFCHRVHHIDRELDVSTGIRFHPLEELISMAIKAFGVVFFGVPVLGVLIFEILLNAGSLFTHANLKLPEAIEWRLRRVLVTPGMHRIHHSDNPQDYNRNFGFCLSIWDKLFQTYSARGLTGEARLSIGQANYREPQYQSFKNLLLHPFNLRGLKPRAKKPVKLWMRWSSDGTH